MQVARIFVGDLFQWTDMFGIDLAKLSLGEECTDLRKGTVLLICLSKYPRHSLSSKGDYLPPNPCVFTLGYLLSLPYGLFVFVSPPPHPPSICTQ